MDASRCAEYCLVEKAVAHAGKKSLAHSMLQWQTGRSKTKLLLGRGGNWWHTSQLKVVPFALRRDLCGASTDELTWLTLSQIAYSSWLLYAGGHRIQMGMIRRSLRVWHACALNHALRRWVGFHALRVTCRRTDISAQKHLSFKSLAVVWKQWNLWRVETIHESSRTDRSNALWSQRSIARTWKLLQEAVEEENGRSEMMKTVCTQWIQHTCLEYLNVWRFCFSVYVSLKRGIGHYSRCILKISILQWRRLRGSKTIVVPTSKLTWETKQLTTCLRTWRQGLLGCEQAEERAQQLWGKRAINFSLLHWRRMKESSVLSSELETFAWLMWCEVASKQSLQYWCNYSINQYLKKSTIAGAIMSHRELQTKATFAFWRCEAETKQQLARNVSTQASQSSVNQSTQIVVHWREWARVKIGILTRLKHGLEQHRLQCLTGAVVLLRLEQKRQKTSFSDRVAIHPCLHNKNNSGCDRCVVASASCAVLQAVEIPSQRCHCVQNEPPNGPVSQQS